MFMLFSCIHIIPYKQRVIFYKSVRVPVRLLTGTNNNYSNIRKLSNFTIITSEPIFSPYIKQKQDIFKILFLSARRQGFTLRSALGHKLLTPLI